MAKESGCVQIFGKFAICPRPFWDCLLYPPHVVLNSNKFPRVNIEKKKLNPSKAHGLAFPKNQYHADLGESIMQITFLSGKIDEAYEINSQYIIECPATGF